MNIYLLSSSFILCFSGFVIAFYGILAESMMELEHKIGVKRGIDLMTSEGAEYYAKKYDKWKAGRLFASSKSLYLGISIVIVSLILNNFSNSFLSTLFILVVSYYLYVVIAKSIGWKIQSISIIIGILSLLISIYLVFV